MGIVRKYKRSISYAKEKISEGGRALYKKEISKAVINRLPRYYRYLGDLLEKDVVRISSKELSEKMKVTASQIRQDLNNFGGFGQQGYGYNLGQALANYVDFERRGFFVKAIFDVSPKLIGTQIRNIIVRSSEDLEEYIKHNQVDIAAITVPKTKAPVLAADLAKWGIKGIWNFAPTDLNLPKDVTVENVHLAESLMKLSYRLSGRDDMKS